MSFKDWFTQEYDRDLGERIKRATQFSMSDTERAQTRDFLVSYMRMHPARMRQARKQSWLSWSLNPYPIIAGLLIVALGGSSAGAASLAEQALPGDLLYPIKVNVNEEIRAALAQSPEKKADVALARAERRIEELNTLATRGELSEEVRTEIDDRIDEHVHDAEIETVLAENGGRERRLVAMLRVHENLIAESGLGGTMLEPDVSISAMVAHDAAMSAEIPEPEAALTSVSEEEAVTMTMQAPEVENVAHTAAQRAPEEVVVAPPVTKKVAAKKTNSDTSTSTKAIARQKKVAEQRIESLEKFLSRNGLRVEASALAHAQSELTAAETAYAEGVAFFEDNSLGDATVRFNAAIRIAIDAREFLADTPKTGDKTEETEAGEVDSRKPDRQRGGRDD